MIIRPCNFDQLIQLFLYSEIGFNKGFLIFALKHRLLVLYH